MCGLLAFAVSNGLRGDMPFAGAGKRVPLEGFSVTGKIISVEKIFFSVII